MRDPPPAAALPTAAKEKIGSWQRPSRRCRPCADISPSSSWPDAHADPEARSDVQAATNERPRLPRKKASRTRQWLHPLTSHAGCYPSLAAALPAAEAKERMGSGSVSRRCLLARHPARLDKPSEEGSKERVTSPAHHHLLQPCCISSPEASILKLTTMCRQANAQRLPSTPRKKTRASRVAGSSWRRSRSPCRWLQCPLWHHPKKASVPG